MPPPHPGTILKVTLMVKASITHPRPCGVNARIEMGVKKNKCNQGILSLFFKLTEKDTRNIIQIPFYESLQPM